METRPKRSVKRRNYREMVEMKIPRISTKFTNGVTEERGVLKEPPPSEGKLYRLQIVEKDSLNGLVKVRYIGYDNTYDEWRPESDIVDLSEEDQVQEGGGTVSTAMPTVTEANRSDTRSVRGVIDNSLQSEIQPAKHFNLYEELLLRIKSLLCSPRKGDPVCCISMGFDTIHFEGLARRGVVDKKLKQNVYTLTALTKLDDILGSRWYIRGINTAGDFCYVEPRTVKYQLKFCPGNIEYQLLDDGTLKEHTYGIRYQLIFRFVRGDGISSQWYNILIVNKMVVYTMYNKRYVQCDKNSV